VIGSFDAPTSRVGIVRLAATSLTSEPMDALNPAITVSRSEYRLK
jgi:hypothetical protein